MTGRPLKVLFVTWDSGAVDYLASLFFPVFHALRAHGVEVHTLQGTWGSAEDVARSRAAAEALGLPFQAIRFPVKNRKVRMAEYVGRLAAELARVAAREDVDVVMPRALIPSAATVLAKPSLRGRRIVWDADGLPADERVDFAGWSKRGLPYRALRQVERAMLRLADQTMVRTANAAEILRARAGKNTPRIVVVPNGRDAERYAPSDAHRTRVREQEGIAADAPLLISVGSLGPQYYPEVQVALVASLLRQHPKAWAVFLSAQAASLEASLREAGAPLERVVLRRVPAPEVAPWLAAADVGLALRAPAFSQQAVCPLKVGEYLLSGLPVIATRGVGDLDTQLGEIPALLVDDASAMDVDAAARWIMDRAPLDASTRSACRAQGLRHFSLDAALEAYLRLFREA